MRNNTPISAFQAVQNAQSALQGGNKSAARKWAVLAAKLAPEREEPWLLMAALGSPQASLGYLNQALKINPQSARALAGLTWANKRAEAGSVSHTQPGRSPQKVLQTTSAQSTQVAKSAGSSARSKAGQKFGRRIILLLALIIAIALLNASSVRAFFFAPDITKPSAWLPINFLRIASTAPLATSTDEPKLSTSLSTLERAAESSTAIIPSIEPVAESSHAAIYATKTVAASINTPTASTAPATPTALPTDTGPATKPSESGPNDNHPVPAYAGGKWILVDISEQHMYVYEGEVLVYSFVTSTGMNNATRIGNFAVQSKIPNAWGSTWSIWMPSWLGIYNAGSLENGIHALPILPSGATLWGGYLGTPISYGCVVLGTYEAQLLYDWAEIGVPVIIQW